VAKVSGRTDFPVPVQTTEKVQQEQFMLFTLESLRERLRVLDEELMKVQELGKEREQVRQAIFALELVVGGRESTPAPDGIPVWQHVQNLFNSKHNEPMAIPQIMKGLDAKGVKFESQNPSESVRTILIRKPDIFERLEGGKFRIK
jgi:hypothetical protein